MAEIGTIEDEKYCPVIVGEEAEKLAAPLEGLTGRLANG